jgi:hypothetical protein
MENVDEGKTLRIKITSAAGVAGERDAEAHSLGSERKQVR